MPFPPPLPPPSLQDMFPIYVVLSILWLVLVIFPVLCYRYCCLVSTSQDIEQGTPTNISAEDERQVKEQTIGEVLWASSLRGKDVIKNWSECVICLEEFEEGDKCGALSECKHIYHKACINKWLIREAHCPVCRSSVSITL